MNPMVIQPGQSCPSCRGKWWAQGNRPWHAKTCYRQLSFVCDLCGQKQGRPHHEGCAWTPRPPMRERHYSDTEQESHTARAREDYDVKMLYGEDVDRDGLTFAQRFIDKMDAQVEAEMLGRA